MRTSDSKTKNQGTPPSADEDAELALDSIVSESSRMIAAQRALEAQTAFPLATDHLASILAGDQAIATARRKMLERGTRVCMKEATHYLLLATHSSDLDLRPQI